MKNKFLKRLTAGFLAITLTIASPLPMVSASTASTEPVSEVTKENIALAKQLERESIVLAQNSRGILPLDPSKEVAVFGRGQIAPTTGGSGSGAANASYTTNFLDGVDALGIKVYDELRKYYEERVTSSSSIKHGWNTTVEFPGEWGSPVYSGTNFNMTSGINTPDVKLDDGEVKSDGIVARAAKECDTAIVFITRTTGSEEMDRTKQPGDWYLDPSEKTLLKQVTDKFDKVVVILSVNGSIDMSWVDEYGIDTVMISYGSGSQTGYAMAELVYGYQNPSAKLADTITKTYEEHPTADNFGYTSYADKGYDAKNAVFGAQDPISVYAEGIYEGYRYFDTFGKEVLYPFGSGLSYSDFTFTDMKVSADDEKNTVSVQATVTNVTEDKEIVAGKEVMEVYVSEPEGTLEQPYQKLVDYTKSDALKSGESQTITIDIPVEDLASYSEEKAAYILEPGYYYFRVGSSSRSTQIAGAIYVEKEIFVEQLSNQLEMQEEVVAKYKEEALSSKEATPITYPGESQQINAAKEHAVAVDDSFVEASTVAPTVKEYVEQALPENAPVYKFSAVQSGEITLEQFISQMTVDELIMIESGGATAGIETYYSDDAGIRIDNVNAKNTANQATTGAGSSRSISRLEIPSVTYADGSAGISYNAKEGVVEDGCVGWSRAAAIACVWNQPLLYEYGVAIGKEMQAINVDIWLAPSINLHRNPLNGRNNEYYSEDPILSGITAGIVATGVNKSGVTVCLKHFAGNDQEHYRRGLQDESTLKNGTSLDAINIISSERALREITLKPFEIAVKTGAVYNVMASFNKLNGVYTATSEDLLINILHGEWGYDGFVVTDWGDLDTIADPDQEVANGVNTIMSGKHVMYSIPEKIYAGYDKGTVTKQDLYFNAYYLLNTINHMSLASDETKVSFEETLAIQTTELPIARVNEEYSTVKVNPLIAVGGEGNKNTFSLSAISKDQLPEGLKLLPNGSITGEPKEGTQGKYELTFVVTDAAGKKAEKTLTLVVNGELKIQPSELPVAKLNQAYSVQLTAVDKDGKEVKGTYTTSSTLPEGITLSETGLLSGTSKANTNDFTISIQVKTDTKDGEMEYVLHCIEKDVMMALTSLPDAAINESYEFALSAEGGLAPYTFKVSGLPEGLCFYNGKVVSGRLMFGIFYIQGVVPESASGNYEVEIQVTDSLGQVAITKVPIKIGNPSENEELKIVTASLPSGKANEAYTETKLAVQNATGTVTYKLAANSDPLPGRVTLSEDGVISGNIASDGSGIYHIIVEASDEKTTVQKEFELYVAGRLDSDPMAYQQFDAEEGKEFSQTIQALNGPFSTDYTYEISEKGDKLPEGLTLSVSNHVATISGTPVKGSAGSYTILVVMDTEQFAGNPVTTVVPYKIVVAEGQEVVEPTTKPTVEPTAKPTTKPTTKPTVKPTTKPTPKPTVKPIPVTAVKFTSHASKTLDIGSSYLRKAVKVPSNATQSITIRYKSSNTKVAKVDAKTGKVKAVGTGVATIKAYINGNTKKYDTYKVYVKPGKGKITSLKSSKRGTFTVAYKKVKNASGYEIMYSTSKSFTSYSLTRVSGGTKVKKTITNLRRGKKYYVKVRAIKVVSNKVIRGSFSSVKTIKVR